MTQAIKLIFHCVVVSRDILRSFAMLLMTITDFLYILFDFSTKKKLSQSFSRIDLSTVSLIKMPSEFLFMHKTEKGSNVRVSLKDYFILLKYGHKVCLK